MAEEAKSEPVRVTRQEAIESARARFGVSPHVVAGALSGETSESFAESRLEKLVKDFQNRDEDQADKGEEDDES